MGSRFYVVSEQHGLVATAEDQEAAERKALVAAVHTARTVYLHDRTTEPTRSTAWPS